MKALYALFQKCLELRDKYMQRSLQRLGDNPRDHDAEFADIDESVRDVPCIKVDAPITSYPRANPAAQDNPKREHIAWEIFPPPPPPHWHRSDAGSLEAHPNPATDRKHVSGNEEFDFTKCEIPGIAEGDMATWDFALDEGVYQTYDAISCVQTASEAPGSRKPLFDIPSIREYFMDLDYVLGVISDGPNKSFAFRRLKYLQNKMSMYTLLYEFKELAEMKRVPHRDFYNTRKVDTHVHHSSSMNQKHLLRFIKHKMKCNPDDVVIFRDNKYLTLTQVFQSLNLSAYDLSIDTLDMHAHQDSFHRFDKFNLKYNPIGESRLREIFLKTDNLIKGRYLAELTQELMNDLEQSKYQNCEWRISIYGRSLEEWDKLAKWIINNKLYSHNVRWLVQVPRLYSLYKEAGTIDNFEDLIRSAYRADPRTSLISHPLDIFQPLFEVTKDPSSHPELHVFLRRVVGFDSVDDESKPERRMHRKYPRAKSWNTTQNPPYSYWTYYMYANMADLNNWRRARGFNTFVFRPHCGEAGDTDNLTSAFLAAHSISHGILLRKVPALQYLFYLKQIGMAMSPLSNNALFLTYERNPFPDFFNTGLNVSLSTDDPLQFHYTKEPLLEEYSVATHIYKFPQASLAELARNSVIQSGFEMEIKRHWLGKNWYLPGAEGNDIHKVRCPFGKFT
ncbi:AMP deaminase [Cantharellus anzutake]|uniref:AMP deaminase n=1 Tax=Cantharellus anzutake TaxID=1750568 RepID=UPI0019072C59|nr:AMP deaminase [Cantharellus anzutake]KAF8318321.1 AMP deaminase [Cantharellus anzutake]